jgi:hypothetical protein
MLPAWKHAALTRTSLPDAALITTAGGLISWTSLSHQPRMLRPKNSCKELMAYKLRTDIGKAIYRLRKSTVEPVIVIIKETLGFRQFSLRGLLAAAGEWTLVCLAYNLKRLHTLQLG